MLVRKLLLLVLFMSMPWGECHAGELLRERMHFSGLSREYMVHLPATYRSDVPAPVVFVFHGGGGNARQIARHSGFNRLADKHGFIVVYPQAVDKHWNDGRNSGKFREHDAHISDVAWMEALIGRIREEYVVNGKRIYAVGISNGGMFCQRLAIELGQYFAAIASLAAQIPEPLAGSRPVDPVSVLMINGTKDPIIPYRGGEIVLRLFPRLKQPGAHAGRGRVISTDDTVRFWLGHNGIDAGAESVMLADADPSDGSTVERSEWTNTESGVSVVLYKVIGGGHTWPGTRQTLPVSVVGRTNRDFDASEAIWQFFAAHAKHAA